MIGIFRINLCCCDRTFFQEVFKGDNGLFVGNNLNRLGLLSNVTVGHFDLLNGIGSDKKILHRELAFLIGIDRFIDLNAVFSCSKDMEAYVFDNTVLGFLDNLKTAGIRSVFLFQGDQHTVFKNGERNRCAVKNVIIRCFRFGNMIITVGYIFKNNFSVFSSRKNKNRIILSVKERKFCAC